MKVIDTSASSINFDVSLYEQNSTNHASTETITLTKSSEAYQLSNYTEGDFIAFSAHNATPTAVEPGTHVWEGMYLTIPQDDSIPVEVRKM